MPCPRFLLLSIFFVLPAAAFPQAGLHFDPTGIDAGYLYVYRGSGNAAAFTPTSTIYLYLSSRRSFQMADLKKLPRGSALVMEDVVMNWDYFTAETDETRVYLSADVPPNKGAPTVIHSRVENDFTSMVRTWETDTDLGEHRAGTARLDKNQLPRFSMEGFPLPFFLAARFLNRDETSTLPITFRSISLGLDIVPGPREDVTYEGTSYRCRRYELVPTGPIGSLLGKKGLLWLDTASGYSFMVKTRDENAPFRECILVERRSVSAADWGEIQSRLVAGLQP